MSRIVIALGGNALGETPYEQKELIKKTVKPIVDLIEKGNDVIIAHGNGPQVGMINLGMSTAAEVKSIKSDVPFPECGAMSQGYIGYHLQNALFNELKERNIDKKAVSLVTQVVVDSEDSAFKNPTKPIGTFYTKEQAEKLQIRNGWKMLQDSGRGYRQVVPSPKPVDIVEKDCIVDLIEKDHIVIAVGGGGIPVVSKNGSLEGVSAVIDKDFATEKLAELVDADYLFILTAVERVAINFGKPNQKMLKKITIEEAKNYAKEGHFAPGSMLPKIEAAILFAESQKGRKTIIAALENAALALEGKSGTIIYM